MTQETDEKKPNRFGVAVVLLLAVVFFSLLALIFLFGRGERPERPGDAGEATELMVVPPRVRIRTQPSAQAPVLENAVRGERLTVEEERGAWVLVRTSKGTRGWADRAYLERPSDYERRLARAAEIRKLPSLAGVVAQRAPLFSGPGPFYPIVGELLPEREVKVYTRDHDFYAVESEGMIAYADVSAIDLSDTVGDARFEVAVSDQVEPAQLDAPPLTTTVVEREPAHEPEPPAAVEPPPVPRPRPDRIGVWASVPPGGKAPEIIRRATPRYPPAARRAGAEGTVVLRAIVRQDGRVDEVEILRDLPFGLGEAARDAVRDWRFSPATYQGQPIDVYYTVTVHFRMPR
jgi:TonB family protein